MSSYYIDRIGGSPSAAAANASLGFLIASRGKKIGKKLWQQIKSITCQQYCTHYWQACKGFLPAEKHRVSKKEIYTIEGNNNVIRHYIARFNRRTHCYSKSELMLAYFIFP